MAEYRLGELAHASGVSSRNIRAYRARGLLDPPRREGRSAIYADRHLSQLRTIDELLRRGFTTAHIADFFASARRGQDLAEILGLQEALFGGRVEPTTVTVGVDPRGDAARRLIARGLARSVDGTLHWVDPTIAQVFAGLDGEGDRARYLQVVVRLADAVAGRLDDVADAVAATWTRGVEDRFGRETLPRPEDVGELRRMIEDYRVLSTRVVIDQLESTLSARLIVETSDFTTDVAVGGRWRVDPEAGGGGAGGEGAGSAGETEGDDGAGRTAGDTTA